MTAEEQERLCEKCIHCKKIGIQWYRKVFLGCFANEYKGKWVAEIEKCPIGKSVKE